MSTKYKTIHFFRLDMYKIENNEQRDPVQRHLKLEEKILYLNNLLIKKLPEKTTMKVHKYNSTDGDNVATVEMVSITDEYAFGKMGREQDINNFQLRENDTLESSPISKNPDQFFEAFSYFVIDRKTCAVSYIMEKSAPRVTFLGDLFTQVFKESDKLWGSTVTIISKDSLTKLAGKDIIGSITYDVTIPKGTHKNITGMSEDDYELVKNDKHTKVKVNLVAEKRKKSMFDSFDDAKQFFQSMGKKTDRVTIRAKDDNENLMQEYRLFDDIMAKRASFNYDTSKTAKEFEEDVMTQIIEQYTLNKSDILEYIGF